MSHHRLDPQPDKIFKGAVIAEGFERCPSFLYAGGVVQKNAREKLGFWPEIVTA